jgi:predicted  nucleic acid-binding Zn-ribbon protein
MDVAADIRVLEELSAVHATLAQLSRQRDEIKQPIRELRARMGEIAARIEGNTRRLAELGSGVPVDPEALRLQIDDDRTLHQKSSLELDRALELAKGPLGQIAAETGAANQQLHAISRGLSLDARRAYRELSRLGRLPFVARLQRDRCEGCHLRVPTSLAGEVEKRRRVHRCPSCKRVFQLDGSDDLAA